MWIKAALLIPERGQTAVHGSWWCRLNWGVMGRTNPPFQLGPREHTVNSGFPLVPNQPNNISEDQHTMKQFHSSITYKKHLSEKRRSGMLPELTDRTKERALREPTHTYTHTFTHRKTLFHLYLDPWTVHIFRGWKLFQFTFIWICGLDTSSEAGIWSWNKAPLWNQQLYSNVACPPPLYLCSLSPCSELCPTHTNWGWASLCQLER